MDSNNGESSVISYEDPFTSIKNALNSSKNGQVKGMAHSVYFFTPSSDAFVRSSPDESWYERSVRMCTSLFSYLLLQGHERSKIVILTLGQRQANSLNRVIKLERIGFDVQVNTVDKFNEYGDGTLKIIILLVDRGYFINRTDEDGTIDSLYQLFLSFAHCKITGLYMIGDENVFLTSDKTGSIVQLLRLKKLLGPVLHLKCSSHGKEQDVRSPDDFPVSGGCYEVCRIRLPCDHLCSELCHPMDDHDHEQRTCTQACRNYCENGHPCPLPCHRPYECDRCPYELTKQFPHCYHTVSVKCSETRPGTFLQMKCQVVGNFRLPCKHKLQFKCGDRSKLLDLLNTYECQRFVAKKLQCGHMKAIRCSQPIERAKCMSTVVISRPLECGHFIKDETKCYKKYVVAPKKSPKCKLFCPRTLACGHQCQFECEGPMPGPNETYTIGEASDEDHDEIHPCMETCRRKCEHAHECGKKHSCQQKICPPCTVDISYSFAGCKHVRTVPCSDFGKNFAKYCIADCERPRPQDCNHPCPVPCKNHVRFENECPPCQIMVTKRRDCGHKIDMKCGQDIHLAPICQEVADVKIHSPCGHSILVPCHEAVELVRNGNANLYCNLQCNFYFDPKLGGCGHRCKGFCSACAINRFHEPCDKICGKQQFCGHICMERCSTKCPPCEQRCETVCEHRSCDRICALPCEPCMEPCSYSCPHGECTKKCSEICDKEPCLEHCTNQLKCGHLCCGFCGEPCPLLCLICDEKELLAQDLIGKSSITSTDRFINLVDCGHTVDAEALELLMTVTAENDQTLPKKCPVSNCQNDVIRSCNRFKGITLKIRGDIEKVKRKIYGYPKEIWENQKEAFTYINSREIGPEFAKSMFLDLKDRVLSTLLMDTQFGPFSRINFQKMPLEKAQCLAFVAELYRRGILLLQELRAMLPFNLYLDVETPVQDFMTVVQNWQWPLTAFELRSLRNEWERIEVLSELYRKKGIMEPAVRQHLLRSEKGKKAFEQAVRVATKVGPYGENRKQEMREALAELEDALECKLDITDAERISIVTSFGLAPGRWFKCENLHPFIVEDCGGPTETSVCNECGARIGGFNHQVLSSNQLASEMDGAIKPLYPTALTRADQLHL